MVTVTGTNIHLINGLVCGICVFYTLLVSEFQNPGNCTRSLNKNIPL
jgi:hypothetical protein